MSAVSLLQSVAPAVAERICREYMIGQISGKPVPGEHPGTADLRSLPVDQRTLDSIVKGIGGRGAAFDPQFPSMSRALLADVLDPALLVVSKAYPQPAHRQFCTMLTAPNYRENRFIVGMDGLDVEEVLEAGEYPVNTERSFDSDHQPVSIRQYGRIVNISRQTVVNDGTCQYFRDVGNALTAACYRKESALVYSALEANGNLEDGSPWFDTTNTATSPSVIGGIMKGFETFISQTFSNGQLVDATPAILVTPPDWYLAVADLPSDLVLQKLVVLKSPRITSAYLFAGHSCPSIGLVGLTEGMIPLLETNPKPKLQLDAGLQLKVSHAIGVVPLSRRGVCKISVSS